MQGQLDLGKVSKILEAIKKDSLSSFKYLTENRDYLSLCYGRFPILSLCYLYGSWRIISKYEKQLALIKDYIFVEEDEEAYIKLKKNSKRALRLFVGDGKVIEPYEMLAVLESNIRLKRYLKKYPVDEKDYKRIERIYLMTRKQETSINNGRLKIKSEKISAGKLATIIVSTFVCCVLIVLSSLFLYFTTLVPNGTEEHPYVIRNGESFENLISETAYSELDADITISALDKDYTGVLNGNHHTITINDFTKPLFENMKGYIKDLTIVINNCTLNAEDHLSPVCVNNDGTLENVSVVINNCTINIINNVTESGNSRYVGLICARNYGNIKSCKVTVNNLTLNGVSNVNGCFGAIAGYNSNIVDGCATLEGNIVSDTIDLGGIVGENAQTGNVLNCTNNANIKQETTVVTWSPNVAGIVYMNYGLIQNCINNGTISAYQTGETTDNLNVFAAGITCVNNYVINHCKNTGDIVVESKSSIVFMGGICAYSRAENMFSRPEIDNCGSIGKAIIKNNENLDTYCGGIIGFNGSCIVTYAFTSWTLQTTMDTTNVYCGGICGLINGMNSQGNYYVTSTGIIGISAIVNNFNNIVRLENDEGTYITSVTSFEELRKTEAYWE